MKNHNLHIILGLACILALLFIVIIIPSVYRIMAIVILVALIIFYLDVIWKKNAEIDQLKEELLDIKISKKYLEVFGALDVDELVEHIKISMVLIDDVNELLRFIKSEQEKIEKCKYPALKEKYEKMLDDFFILYNEIKKKLK